MSKFVHQQMLFVNYNTLEAPVTTLSIQCTCGKICKNERAERPTRVKCLTAVMLTQCTEVTSGKTQEKPGSEATHSAKSLLVSQTTVAGSSPATLSSQETSPNNPKGRQQVAETTGTAPSAQPKDTVALILKQS